MPQRTSTGHHTLLPAADASNEVIVPLVPSRSFFAWTIGRGTAVSDSAPVLFAIFL